MTKTLTTEELYLLDPATLAEQIGVTRQAVHSWVTRERLISTKRAVQLEKLTGIPRESWAWPEKFGNEWLERWQKITEYRRKVKEHRQKQRKERKSTYICKPGRKPKAARKKPRTTKNTAKEK